jgi:hypothetical protein
MVSKGSVFPIAKKQIILRTTALSVSLAILASIVLPVAVATTAAQTETVATDNNNQLSSVEIKNSLRSIPGVLDASDQITSTSDSDSAATTTLNGTTVDIPKDAVQGVTFGAETGPKLDITLPNAEGATKAKQVAPGVTGYDSSNGSANAVQPTEDGGVRMLTIIDNPNAPTAYEYKVTIPGGGHIELTEGGGAVVLNEANQPVSFVAAPWAKDATGKIIETHFTTDGQALTQHVEHNVPGVVYPVTADPFWSSVKNAISKTANLAKQAFKLVWKGALGCIAGKELAQKGVKYFISKAGKKYLLSRLGTKWVPYIGWVSCGYGAWVEIRG